MHHISEESNKILADVKGMSEDDMQELEYVLALQDEATALKKKRDLKLLWQDENIIM